MWTRRTVIVVLALLALVPLTPLMAQQSGPSTQRMAELTQESARIGTSIDALERQLRDIVDVPHRVANALANAQRDHKELDAAIARSNERVASRRARSAASDLARVSRFLLERDDIEANAPEPPEHRLRSRLVRFASRLDDLVQQAQELDLALDVADARAALLSAKTLLEQRDNTAARSTLATLKGRLEEIGETIDQAREAFMQAQEELQ